MFNQTKGGLAHHVVAACGALAMGVCGSVASAWTAQANVPPDTRKDVPEKSTPPKTNCGKVENPGKPIRKKRGRNAPTSVYKVTATSTISDAQAKTDADAAAKQQEATEKEMQKRLYASTTTPPPVSPATVPPTVARSQPTTVAQPPC